MRTFLVTASLIAGAFFVPTTAHAEEAKVTADTNAVAAAVPVEVGNKICPVSHEAVGQNGMEPQKVTYKDKVYNLCCSMCIKDFNKDPEKYTAIADKEVQTQ